MTPLAKNGPRRDIIVVGASAGGVEAVSDLLAELPPDLTAALLVVVHTSPVGRGLLPQVLQRKSRLPVEHGEDGETVRPGHVYVARPDHHLVVSGGRMHVTRGPRENHTRPAIDPLFRSVALAYGQRVIAVVLTGMLHDGSAGLHAVRLCGGTCIVQDPDDAVHGDMPRNAMRMVTPHHVVRRHDLPALLVQLVQEPIMIDAPVPEARKHVEIETRIALGENAMNAGVMSLGPASPYTCPECHGVLLQLNEEGFVRFRCHTGHAYTVESLLATGATAIEDALWNSVRSIEERVMLLRHIAAHARATGDEVTAHALEKQAHSTNARGERIRELATGTS
ncbi:MAG: chemotaxis protein CheB [Gemmatimonadota bacterium]